MVWSGGPPPVRLTVSRSHGDRHIVVLGLVGELDSGTVLIMARAVTSVLAGEPGPEAVVVDMTSVTVVSVAGLRALRAAQDCAAGKGIAFRLVAGRDSALQRTLEVTGMRPVFDTYPSRIAAVGAGGRDQFLRQMRVMWAQS